MKNIIFCLLGILIFPALMNLFGFLTAMKSSANIKLFRLFSFSAGILCEIAFHAWMIFDISLYDILMEHGFGTLSLIIPIVAPTLVQMSVFCIMEHMVMKLVEKGLLGEIKDWPENKKQELKKNA